MSCHSAPFIVFPWELLQLYLCRVSSQNFCIFFSLLFHSNLTLKWKSLSHVWLLWDPMDYTVHGILQARTLKWIAFPFSRESSQPRDWTQVSHIVGRFSTSWATREALLEWAAFPFSSRSSRPRSQTQVSCAAGGFFTNWAIREAPLSNLLFMITHNSFLSIYTNCLTCCFDIPKTVKERMVYLLCSLIYLQYPAYSRQSINVWWIKLTWTLIDGKLVK